ncbi:MAG: hypothetical protein BGO32_05035 [Bacteroidetes bacterium 37-13]|nr:MAG: hypothetical protein BGO32_05035 [Bacteroidetes bacterium 37-13]
MRNWTLPPNKVFMQYGNTTPSVTSITGAPNNTYVVANGAYDENNNLLFYVIDDTLKDASSNYVGMISNSPILKEIVIVPVPGKCRKYYVIVGCPVPMNSSEVLVTVVDCSSGSPSILSGPTQAAFFNGGGNVLGLAASTIISGSGSSATRYLYIISYTQLHRLTISSSGIDSLTTLTNFYPVIGEPTELELRHDGAKLAWGNCNRAEGKVYEILTSSPYTLTTYTLPQQGVCATSNQDISGIEYDFSGNLWVSATSTCPDNKGIYKITTTTTPSYLQLANTGSYDKTQLELSITDYILGLSNSGSFGYINPSSNTFSTTSLNIPITVKSNGSGFIGNVYSLPDQIDHENYAYFNGIEQGIADFKINNVIPYINCSPIQEVYNCNPIAFTNLSTGATSYTLEVTSVDGSCNVTGGLNYNSGTITTLPTDLRSMPGTNGTWLGSNTGRFRVRLTASNGCSTTSKFGYIQVNGTPTAVTSCYTYVNNTTCTGSGISGGVNCASAVSVCQNNPKIKADCSGGQFVQGSYDLVIDEYNSSCVFIQNVANSLNNPLTSTADLVCLSLNDFTTTPGYFYTNFANLRYRVALTIRNVCSSNTTTTWFIDNAGGCKTDGDELGYEESISAVFENSTAAFAQIFPNPSSGNSTLEFNLDKVGKTNVTFSDMQGKVIYRHSANAMKEGTQSIAIPSADWAAGVYFYQLAVGDAVLQGKMIKTD